jgi:hypothetical protein
VFTARYALSPYIKQIRFVFKGLIIFKEIIAVSVETHVEDVNTRRGRSRNGRKAAGGYSFCGALKDVKATCTYCAEVCWFPFLRALQHLRKATINLFMSLCASVCSYETPWFLLKGFSWNLVLGFLLKCVHQITVLVKSDEIIHASREDLRTFLISRILRDNCTKCSSQSQYNMAIHGCDLRLR